MSVDALSQLRTADFLQVTQDADNRTVRLSSNGTVNNTRLPTFVSTNQKTLSEFVEALRRDFGTAIADAAEEQLNSLTNKGSLPLKGFMVRETVDKAVAAMQANINVRDRFFSGIDPAHSFKLFMEGKLNELGIRDEALRVAAMAEAEKEVRAKASAIGDRRLDAMYMESLCNRTNVVGTLQRMEDCCFIERDLPGSLMDKFDLRQMLGYTEPVTTRAIEVLTLCRQIQPNGRLERKTVWLALTAGSTMPKEAENERVSAFAERLSNAVKENLAASIFNGDKALANQAFDNSDWHFHAAVDIAKTKRAVTKEDYIRPETKLEWCIKNVMKDLSNKDQISTHNLTEKSVARDLPRLGDKTLDGKPVTPDIRIHLSDGEYRVKCGRNACDGKPEDGAFQFSDSEEAKETKNKGVYAYQHGSPTEYTANLIEKCKQLCKNRDRQGLTLFSLFSQNTPRIFAGRGRGSGQLISTIAEHAPMHFDLRMGDDDKARFTLTIEDSPEKSGTGTVTIAVSPDGKCEIEDLHAEFATNPDPSV